LLDCTLINVIEGGGDVALLDFRTFDENKPLALRHDIQVTPLPGNLIII
jgi:hypothetical protein